jgi:plastocyanin
MRKLAGAAVFVLFGCGGGGGGGDVTQPPPAAPPPGEGAVQGRVVNETEQGIANVTVSLARSGATTRTATTAATGAFAFQAVAEGGWTVSAQLPAGFEAVGSLTASVQVAANQTATVPLIRMRTAAPPTPGTVDIAIYDNYFEPVTTPVPTGTIVRWSNAGTQIHNTTSTTGAWTSPNLSLGGSFQRTFATPGTFTYACTLHPGMNGTVVVQ